MDGIILINKEKNCTSHDVVNKVKHILNEKVGHTGTLDPNATGLLPILIGKGTKLSKYLINHDKTYEVVLKLGQKTDTADSEGKILEEKVVNLDSLKKENILQVLKSCKGKQKQIPPMYSAIKLKGKKLYEYARKNISVEIEPREIEIYDIQLNDIDKNENLIYFTVACSKGTYIRSLCENIAEKLNTVGYMKELNRVKVGIFDIKDSIKISDLENNKDNEEYLSHNVISIEDLFFRIYGNKRIVLPNNKVELFINGVQLTMTKENGLYLIYNESEKFIGIGVVNNNLLKRDLCLK